MRKLLVKLFIGDTMVILFGKAFNYARPANVVVPAILLMAFLLMDGDYPHISGNDFIGIGLVVLTMFFSLLYFRLKPPSWEEMDLDQKWQYGTHVGVVSLTPVQEKLWTALNVGMRARLQFRKFHNVGWFLINPIAVIITLFLIFI